MLEEILQKYGAYEVSAMEVYTDIFKLGEGFIQCKNEPPGQQKANPIILGSFGGEIRRRILFEDTFEETLNEFQQADWAVTNGLTYWGKANTAENQSKMCAMIFDLDGVEDTHLLGFLYNIHSVWPIYPMPQYIILSGTNCHLYYVFDEPIDLYPYTKTLLKELKYALTNRIWNYYTSTEYERPQYQGINQGFRIIGGKTKKGGTVRAFRVSEHPTTVDELNSVLPEESRVDLSQLYRESKYSLTQAAELFPDWYEQVVLEKRQFARKAWPVKIDLYNWWIRQVYAGASYRHRYFCLMALAIFAVKCGITDRERVKADMEKLVPYLNIIHPENPFGLEGEVESALECFDLRYVTFPRRDLEKITAISMPANKRNFRKQEVHMAVMRAVQDIIDPEHSWRNKEGRPTKADEIRQWRLSHPEGRKADCIRETGLSKPTVLKWWNQDKEN